MTEKEKLFDKIDRATREELIVLHKSVSGENPFLRKSTFLLNDKDARRKVIAEIKDFINTGKLRWIPNQITIK